MFQGWENFYIMTGTAAATLAGLLCVVITLGVSLAATPAARGVHAYMTPVLVHFAGVLFISLILLVPWPSPWPAALILGAGGLGGIGYAAAVVNLLRRLDFVSISPGDWICYAGAPALADAALVAGAIDLVTQATFTPYAIAAAAMLLLFVSIIDAWDMTLWILRHREGGLLKR
jgi:hypothetical protein